MSKQKTVFEKKGMQLFRNGEHIATREPTAVIMEANCEKFTLVATKMLNSKVFNADNGLTPIKTDSPAPQAKVVVPEVEPEVVSQGEPARDVALDMSELKDVIKAQAEQIRELLEMAADKAEAVPAMTTSVVQEELADELRKERLRTAELEDRLANKKTNVYEQSIPVEDPYLVDTDDEINPYGIPEEDFNRVTEGTVPPMPPMDWRGTKTPVCVAWLEDNFPKFSKKRFSVYRMNQKAAILRAERKKKKEEVAKAERELHPRGNNEID